jgi:sugar phosphate isomerase/epimerase
MALELPFATGIALATRDPAERCLSDAARFGCTHFYLDVNNPTDEIDEWPPERVAELQDAIAREGVCPVIHGSLANPVACERSEHRLRGVERASREIALAAAIGAPLILHASSYFPGRTEPLGRDEALEAFETSVEELSGRADESGVELWLENLPKLEDGHLFDAVFARPDEWACVLDACSRASLILDVGHAYVNASSADVGFSAFMPRVVALCLSDNDGSRDQHGPLGSGSIDFRVVLEQLRGAGWSGLVAFETIGSTPTDAVAFLTRVWEELENGGGPPE